MKKSEPRLLTFSGVNLRRDPEVPQMLRRARTPQRIGVRSLLPLCSFEPYGDGRALTLLVADKTLIYTWDGTEIRTIGRVGAEPVMAVTDTPGVVRLLLRHHPDYYYTYGSDLKLTPCGYMPELPEIRLFATGHTPLQQAVAPVKLSGASSGNAGSQLTAADARTLTDALLHAYDALESQARTLGACFQPLLARCRVLDAAGNTLSTGPTVMVAPESFITRRSDSATGDWRCAISVKIASPGGDTVVCREIHGTGHAPEAFAPMLSYPSADAVEIAIDLTGADGHRSGLYPLSLIHI